MRVNEIPKEATENPVIFDSYVKAQSVLKQHESPYCSISGGSDSDIMFDIMTRLDKDKQIRYVWYNTGLEYAATKKHLDYLEERYGVKIERIKPVKSVVSCVQEYGVPFFSKFISDCISGLQHNEFEWEDMPFKYLAEKHPKGNSYIRWWCNAYELKSGSKSNMYNIGKNAGLKEFLVEHPPDFPISAKCCKYAKKKTAAQTGKQMNADLEITGIRRAEGGVRSAHYKNCYSQNSDIDAYRPLFWYSDSDKTDYERIFGICHSDCYEVWGFKRTGCVGCPFNGNVEHDLEIVKQYEPNMYKACQKVFGKSYEYTRQYKEFKEEFKKNRK